MKVVVLIKQVPDTEAKIQVSGGKIQEAGIKWIISPYDEFALEEALRIREKNGGEVVAISVGPDRVVQALRSAYALGVDKVIHIKTEKYEFLDSYKIAEVLTKALQEEGFDLILAGRQGIDSDSGQVPLLVATWLGVPAVIWAKKIELQDSKVVVTSEGEGGKLTFEVSLPALITATTGLNEPRYPSLKGIMASKKKPITTKTFADYQVEESPSLEVVEFMPPPPRPPGRIIEGETAEEKVKNLVKALHEEIKVI